MADVQDRIMLDEHFCTVPLGATLFLLTALVVSLS
jgi:hypothetical protein